MLLFLLSLTVNSVNFHLRTDLFNHSAYSSLIYMTTDDGGVVAFDPVDSSWNFVNSTSGLSSNKTKDLFIKGDSVFVLSKAGITILDRNLRKIDFQSFSFFFSVQDTNPQCIELHEGKVILGGKEGIQWFDLEDFGNLTSSVKYFDYNFEIFDILPLDTCYLLGTSNGIYRVDSSFDDTVLIDPVTETYSLAIFDNSIWAGGSWGCKEITTDSAFFSDHIVWTIGNIEEDVYIGTNGGLYKYDGSWDRLHTGEVRGFAQVSPFSSIVSVVRNEGLRFIDSSDYIYPPCLASNMIADLTRTPDGKIYVVHEGTKEISVFDGKGWEVVNRGNIWDFPGGSLLNVESDSEGRIYFGFWYWEVVPILFCWDSQNDTMPRPIELPFPATTVTGLLVDSNNDLWVGLLRTPEYGEGQWVLRMHRVNEDSLEWTKYEHPEVIWKRVFAEGSEGIYCGNSPSMGGAGIHILKDDGTIEEVRGNLGSSTLSMTADPNGNIWAGLESGLVYISGSEVEEKYTSSNSGLGSDKVDGVVVDSKGGLWCYDSWFGLSYLNSEGNWKSLPKELLDLSPFNPKMIVYPLHFINDNILYVGTYGGLYEFELGVNGGEIKEIEIYPNPFNCERHKRLHFSAEDLGGKRILIYDIVGELKVEYTVPSVVNDFQIEIDLPSGLYQCFVTKEGQIFRKGKFVVVR